MIDVTGLVLAAGNSTRIRSVIAGLPKPLIRLPFPDSPTVLERNLRWLAQSGLESTWINLHYRPEEIERVIGDGIRLGLRVRYSHEETLRGTAGALRALRPQPPGTTLVVYGDSLVRFDLDAFLRDHRRSQAPLTVALFDQGVHPHTGIAGGRVELDMHADVRGFVEGQLSPSRLVNAGVYLVEPSVLGNIPPDQEVDFARHVFPQMLASGQRLHGHLIDGYCLGLDTPQSLQLARELLGSGRVTASPGPDPQAQSFSG